MDFTERSTRVYRTKQLYTKDELAARESLCVHEQSAFCAAACPLRIDARELSRLCAEGDFTAARAMLERAAPFARILAAGCEAPCASACRLNEAGAEGVNIPALERAAMRHGKPRTGRGLLKFKKKKTAAVFGAELFTLVLAAELAAKSYPAVFYISEGTAAELIARCAPFLGGEDAAAALSELEKLVSYTLGRDVITDEAVQAVCITQVTSRIFDMIAAISNRQVRKAMDLYEDLLTLKEPPMRILFLIARQFNQILQVKELAGKGMDKGTIASRLKLSPYVAGKIMLQARSFTKEQILEYVTLCVDTEEAVKTGRIQDRLAVELLITKEY